MPSTGGPEAELHDSRRKQLLQALKDALPNSSIVRSTEWARLWLSDIDKLEDLVAKAQADPDVMSAALGNVERCREMVLIWTQRKRVASTASSLENSITSLPPSSVQQSLLAQQLSSTENTSGSKRISSGSKRSKLKRDLCHQRDQMRCVLTKAGEPNEVAYIYPFSMRHQDDRSYFWATLRMFWSKERVTAWYKAVFPHGTEACQNLICLAPNAHAYWERAYFALKPIRLSHDKKRLDVQFFWLQKSPYSPEVDILCLPQLPADSDQGPNFTKLFDNETDKPIRSGHKISLKTDDPDLRPLPDFRLLEMQWFLHRVTAMSGAAGHQDDLTDEESDGDITTAFQEWDLSTEYDWDVEMEEEPAALHF